MEVTRRYLRGIGAARLATLIAAFEADARRESGPGAQNDGHRYGALLVTGLTLLAVAMGGYHPFAEDGGLYVAGVKRLLDPALYPASANFVLEPMRLSLFAQAVACLVRITHLGLPVVLLLLHLASVWATLFATWMLARRCWHARKAQTGAVVLLACWLSLPVAGTALMLMDPYVTARSFSTPCMVLALVGTLEFTGERRGRGLVMWAGGILLAGAMHPLMAAYALGATLLLACFRSPRRGVQLWGTAALCAAAVGLAGFLQALAAPESAEYVRVAMTRTYWYPAEWRWFEIMGLAAPLMIVGFQGWVGQSGTDGAEVRPFRNGSGDIGAPTLVSDKSAMARSALVAGSAACLVAVLLARAGASTHLVARLQPLRIFQIVYLVMVLMLGAKLGDCVLRQSTWRWLAAITLLGGVMFCAASADFPYSRHLELPKMAARNQWVQAFLWIRENTPKNALFALDPDYINAPGEDAQCFRAIAERSALPDYSKDGGEASIAPELAGEWQAGQAAQQSLSSPGVTDQQRLSALKPLGVEWLVMQGQAETNLSCPYTNRLLKVCRLQ